MAEEATSSAHLRRPDPPGHLPLPPGRIVHLATRGDLFVRELPGPTPDAPCLLLLHGLTSNADLNWFATFETLGRSYRVIAPDQRGHGDGMWSEPFKLKDLADDAAVLIDQLGVGPLIVVGFSMGGAVTQLLWRRHPDVVAGLVLCATAGDYREPTTRGRFVQQPLRHALGIAGRVLPPRARDRLVELASRGTLARVQPTAGKDDPIQRWGALQLLRSDPLRVAAASAALRRYHDEAWADTVTVPVSMVVTERDDVVLTERQHALARALGATVHTVAAGHGAFIEKTELFVPALVAACDDVAGRL